MSEKNGKIASELYEQIEDMTSAPIPVDCKKIIHEALDTKDRDHEALIGVLVGALNGLLSIRSTTCGGDYCGKCDRCVAKKAISHPLVQEYLKKEKP